MSPVAREKRLDVLAEIARRLPNHPIAMYGTVLKFAPPPDLSWLDKAPNVDFRGRYKDIYSLPLNEFSSYIFTSGAEGMPIALLEAAMLGLPLIAPAVGGIREFVDGATGWLITEPGDAEGYVAAIREAGADRAMAARRVAKAQQRLQDEYSWDAFLSTLNAIPS
jgi:glycosyltransferase involved in cell wall biosynthesis